MIEIQNLQFHYQQKSPLLRIPEFQVAQGEKVFLFGPSGSGKTTLLELLAGISQCQSGKIKVAGSDLATMPAQERDHFRAQNIGVIFQSFNLVPFLTVWQNIELPSLFQGQGHKDQGQALKIIERLGLQKLVQQKASELSVGQQQRVAVARALYQAPKVILADEPTSALDYDHREKFLNLLFELAAEQNITILFVSHDRSIAKLFDRQVSLLEINEVKYDLA